jgi:hypothetical protein
MQAGRRTPGQKNETGNGVIVKSHAVANATRLEIPDMYAMTLVICHVGSASMNTVSKFVEYAFKIRGRESD